MSATQLFHRWQRRNKYDTFDQINIWNYEIYFNVKHLELRKANAPTLKYSQAKKWKCNQVYNTHFDFDTKVTVWKSSSHFTIVLLHGAPPSKKVLKWTWNDLFEVVIISLGSSWRRMSSLPHFFRAKLNHTCWTDVYKYYSSMYTSKKYLLGFRAVIYKLNKRAKLATSSQLEIT